MASDLTRAQRDMLEVVCPEGKREPAWWDAPRLLVHLYDHHRTSEGVHVTAASLVRRGFLEKTRNRLGTPRVAYKITPKGREMVAALRSLDKAAER